MASLIRAAVLGLWAAVLLRSSLDGRLDLFVTNVGRFTTEQVGSSGGAETASGGESDTYYVGDKDAFVGHLHPERSEPRTG